MSPVIAITDRHQGIHDPICSTVVEVVDPESRKGRLAAYDPVLDVCTATMGARVLSTLGYALAISGAGVVVVLVKVVACGPESDCGRAGDVAVGVIERLWFVLMYAVLWLGPAGRLPGAR